MIQEKTYNQIKTSLESQLLTFIFSKQVKNRKINLEQQIDRPRLSLPLEQGRKILNFQNHKIDHSDMNKSYTHSLNMLLKHIIITRSLTVDTNSRKIKIKKSYLNSKSYLWM